MQAERRVAIGDAALPDSGKLYFTQKVSSSVDPFHACSDYLRKIGRKGGNLKQRRYFYVGKRHGVQIFEPYDLQKNAQQTYVGQRIIKSETNSRFVAARESYRVALRMEA